MNTIKPFDNKIWLSSPTMHGEEQAFVKEAFDTNWVSTVGENLNELERVAADYTGCAYGVALSSGTAALHMALRLADVKAEETVFCSDLTFDATVNPVVYEKAKPVFIDSEYETWNMDPEALERAFEKYPETRVVIIVNLYGVPAQMDRIRGICEEHDAILIEDAAESLGATYKGKQTGSFGNYNAISFNGNKIITTSGGGMLLTDDSDAAASVRKWSTQARDNAPWYQHSELGFNYRMSNILAGIGRGQFMHLEEHIAQKKALYLRYKEGFKELPASMNPFIAEDMEPNYWLSCMLIGKNAMCPQTRTETQASYIPVSGKSCPTQLLEQLQRINAEGRPIWKPMHLQPIFKGCDFISSIEGEDTSSDIFQRGICLPSDNKITEEQQNIIIDTICNCFD